MSSLVYPTVRGLTFNVTKTPQFSTMVRSSPDPLNETRIPQAQNPVWHWSLVYDYLKNDPNDIIPALTPYTDYQTLQGFILGRHGQYDSFLYDDPTDDTVTNQILPLVTDGAGNFYSPIQRNFGGQFMEDITDLNPLDLSGLVVKANGVTKTIGIDFNVVGPRPGIPGYSFQGLVIAWAAMPTAPITASFNFYFRVRFESDSFDIEQFMQFLWTIGGSKAKSGKGYLQFRSDGSDSVPMPAVVVGRGPKPSFIQSNAGLFDQSILGQPAELTFSALGQARISPSASPQTIALAGGFGDLGQIQAGTILSVDDGGIFGGGNPELVTVLAVSGNSITGIFTKAHVGEEILGDTPDDPHGPPRSYGDAESFDVSLRNLFVQLPFTSQVGDVVFVSFGATPALNTTPFTIRDNLGNAYAPVAFVAGSGFGNTSGGVYMTTVTVPGRITVELRLSGPFQHVEMALDSYVGPLTVDQIVSHTNSGNGGNSTGVLTTFANELLYSIGIAEGGGPCVSSFVPPAAGGWTTRDSPSDGPCGLATWDKTVSAIGTYVSDPQVVSPASGPGSGGVSAFLVFLLTFR